MRPEIVLGGGKSPLLTLLIGDAEGGFSTVAEVSVAQGVGGFADLIAVDLDADGQLDAVGSIPASDLVVAVLRDGEMGLGDPKVTSLSGSATGVTGGALEPRRLAAGDVTGDSVADVVAATRTSIVLLAGKGDGTFSAFAPVEVSSRAADLAVHDVDADGATDLLAAFPEEDVVRVYGGDGRGVFAPRFVVSVNEPRAIALAEFNGDSHPDLAVASAADGTVFVWPGTQGGFGTEPTHGPSLRATRLEAADIDGDRLADLLAVDEEEGVVRILLGNGDGTLDRGPVVDVGEEVAGIAVADLNGDCLPDLVLTTPGSEQLVIATNAPPLPCAADCNGNGVVSIDELITGVNIALGTLALDACPVFDSAQDGVVTVDELISAVLNALEGCPSV